MSDGKVLEEELDRQKRQVRTDSYPMSIGELASSYEANELILKPGYQRYFRWEDSQKSLFIESILIGLPIPAIFVATDKDGKWEVVDGLQRLSTIFEFMGILKEEDRKSLDYGKDINFNLKEDVGYIPSFIGKSWVDLPQRIKIDFRRTKMHLMILGRSENTERNEEVRFELFQRLNNGGSKITGQELRNAVMDSDCPDLLKWLEYLSGNKDFIETVSLSRKKINESFDIELVLRFIMMSNEDYLTDIKKNISLDTFLTKILKEKIIPDFQNKRKKFDTFENNFKRTFSLIKESKEENTFKKGNANPCLWVFEFICLLISYKIDNIDKQYLEEVFCELESSTLSEEIRKIIAGKTSTGRIDSLVEFSKKYSFSKDNK